MTTNHPQRRIRPRISLRTGGALLRENSGAVADDYTWFAVPLTVSYVGLGSQTHMFEMGDGIVIHNFDNSVSWGAIGSGRGPLRHAGRPFTMST